MVYCKVPKLYIVCKLDPWQRYYYKNSFDQIELKVPFSVFHLRIRRKFTLNLFLLWQNLICKKLPFVGEKFLLKKISSEENSLAHLFKQIVKPQTSSCFVTPTPKFLGTAKAYFICHIGPNFQISLIYVLIGCLYTVDQ